MAKSNPLRFSTKYHDDETDLLYYGYRYYNVSTGRWPTRDPAGENGGLNMYGFLGANPVTRLDYLGLEFIERGPFYVFGITANKGTTDEDFKWLLVPSCGGHCACKFHLLKFRVTEITRIAVYSVRSYDEPPPYKPYTQAELARNAAHEAIHRRHAHQWHDQAYAEVQAAIASAHNYSCEECSQRAQAVREKIDNSWDAYKNQQGDEANHRGPDWTDADRARTPGEINEDPGTWSYETHDRLDDTVPSPYWTDSTSEF